MASGGADVVIVGAGIVGLATALGLREREPGLRITVLEKEAAPGRHQSGHNSGVIHSGAYYRPGSLKARLCVEGARRMVEFCRAAGVAHRICGKLIVAARERELPALAELERRAAANGVEGTRLDAAQLRELEPNVTGLAALHLGSSGIADYPGVVSALARRLAGAGVRLELGTELLQGRRDGSGLQLRTTCGGLGAGLLINCAGQH